MQAKWERALPRLKEKVSEAVYSRIFANASVVARTENKFMVVLPEHVLPSEAVPYTMLLEASWREANNTDTHIEFKFRAAGDPALQAPAEAKLKPFERRSIEISPNYTFENFVSSKKSELAYNAAFAIADGSEQTNKYNPLFIYGAPGLGKTHLLMAIGNFVRGNDPMKKVCYITARDFQDQYITSVRENVISEFSEYYRSLDVLLIDDVQHWSGSTETQNEFFHIFNALYQAGKPIALTSDVPAVEIKDLVDRLVSRFSWGLTADIKPPDLETRIAILHKKAMSQHIDIPEEVIKYLAEEISGNVRFLESSITKLTMQAGLQHHDIDLDIAKQVVKEILPNIRRRVNANTIVEAASKHFDIPLDKLYSPDRGTQDVAKARQVAMFLMRELSACSLQTIGKHFGGRDHSTVINACKRVQKMMEEDPVFEREIETLKASIK